MSRSYGLRPATTGAKIAASARTSMKIAEATASLCRRNRSQVVAARERDGRSQTSSGGAAGRTVSVERWLTRRPASLWRSGIPNARIDDGVAHVGEQVAQEDQRRGDEAQAHQDRVVALADGGEAEPAHARPGEDRLDDHRAAEEPGQAQADDRDQRDQRVAERVAVDHSSLR